MRSMNTKWTRALILALPILLLAQASFAKTNLSHEQKKRWFVAYAERGNLDDLRRLRADAINFSSSVRIEALLKSAENQHCDVTRYLLETFSFDRSLYAQVQDCLNDVEEPVAAKSYRHLVGYAITAATVAAGYLFMRCVVHQALRRTTGVVEAPGLFEGIALGREYWEMQTALK
jgi:hypothetical protein